MKFAKAAESKLKTSQIARERKMKNHSKQSGERVAFTIVELLTVITIIAILIGILVPSLRAVQLAAKKVKQKSQLHAIDTALEAYRTETGDYPPSDWQDTAPTPTPYCGALKLAEAMLGQDLFGQHVDSDFRADGIDTETGEQLYTPDTLDSRLPVYLKLENANAFKMRRILFPDGADTFNSLWPERYVLCDGFGRGNRNQKIGMPILYYRAHPENRTEPNPHDPNDRIYQYVNNIYNYNDNYQLLLLGIPGRPADVHPLAGDPPPPGQQNIGDVRFYEQIRYKKVGRERPWPYNAESFILISAGPDGKYGTPDDLGNYNY